MRLKKPTHPASMRMKRRCRAWFGDGLVRESARRMRIYEPKRCKPPCEYGGRPAQRVCHGGKVRPPLEGLSDGAGPHWVVRRCRPRRQNSAERLRPQSPNVLVFEWFDCRFPCAAQRSSSPSCPASWTSHHQRLAHSRAPRRWGATRVRFASKALRQRWGCPGRRSEPPQ